MQSIITSIIVAVGLSMDAFSLSILYGTLGLSIRKIILLSVVVGVFHFFMPIIGNLFGSLITKYISVNLDIVDKSGSWFGYNGERIGQGRENVKNYLKENPEVMKEIEEKIRAKFSEAFEKSLGDDEEEESEEE